MAARTIMWFRRDLRLRDNPALGAALGEGDVLPLFVIDPAFDGAGVPRHALLHDCVRALDDATVVRHGDPVDEADTRPSTVAADRPADRVADDPPVTRPWIASLLAHATCACATDDEFEPQSDHRRHACHRRLSTGGVGGGGSGR